MRVPFESRHLLLLLISPKARYDLSQNSILFLIEYDGCKLFRTLSLVNRFYQHVLVLLLCLSQASSSKKFDNNEEFTFQEFC